MGNKCEAHFCSQKRPALENRDWMGTIPDDTLLSDLTIPGTHNSCGFFGFGVVVTQTWSIPLQLNAGIRYFDLRLRVVNNELHLYHGFLDQKVKFDDVLSAFIDFLEKQKTETILMAIQEEYDSKKSNKDIDQLYNESTKKCEDKIIEFSGNPIFMGEARGKIIFINAIHISISKIPGLRVQNNWVVNFSNKIFEKKRKIKEHFIDAFLDKTPGFLYINYLSASSDYLMVSASKIAKETNKIPFKFKGRLGIVLCDFPGEQLIKHLIAQNAYNSNKNFYYIKPEDSIIKNGDEIYVINYNSMKFLSLGDGGKLICKTSNYSSYIINKNDQSSKEIGIDQEIHLTHIKTGRKLEYTLTKTRVNPFSKNILGVEKDKERFEKEKVVRDKDCVLFYNIDPEIKKKVYLCSDYSMKDKKAKIQKVEVNYEENDNKNRWYIRKLY